MKRILFVGLIALLVLLAVPSVMAADPVPQSLELNANLPMSLALTLEDPYDGTWALVDGDNTLEDAGTLKVDALRTDWQVTTTTGNAPHPDNMYSTDWLVNPLKQQQGDESAPVVVTLYTLSGPQTGYLGTTTDTIKYYQKIITADEPGDYTITVTYTVAAVA